MEPQDRDQSGEHPLRCKPASVLSLLEFSYCEEKQSSRMPRCMSQGAFLMLSRDECRDVG